MNERRNGTAGRNDEELRELLRGETASTSRDHDQRVLGAAGDAAREIASRRGGRRTRRRAAWLLPVAAALAVAALVPMLETPSPPETITRQPDVSVTPAHRATLSEAPAVFEWPAVAGARSYRFELRDASAELLWQSEALPATQLDPGPAALDAMSDGGTFLWVVTAETRSGATELGPFWFRLED